MNTQVTNVSIFDRPYLESLFGGVEFPDGSFAIDHIEDLIHVQEVFMETVSEIRKVNMFTYPVLTFCILKKPGLTDAAREAMMRNRQWDLFVDDKFARWASKHNMQWYDSNFFLSDNVGTLSNCPLRGDTQILYWSDYYHQFKLSPVKELYANLRRDEKDSIEVLNAGRKVRCKINKFNESADYVITLVNGATIATTAGHLNKVYQKDYVRTDHLTVDDYLPISRVAYEETDHLTYEQGKLVGMFLGDGSYRNKTEVTFSLNSITDRDDIEFLKSYCARAFDAKFVIYDSVSTLSGNPTCVNVSVNAASLRGLITQFVEGSDALTKAISLRALSCSKEFRQGILDGLYTTDGSKNQGGGSNRIYTSSEKLKDTLVLLCASLGLGTTVSVDTRENRLGTNPNYTIRYYTPNGRTTRKDVYILDDQYMWFKIKSIERAHKTEVSYCLEVLEDDAPEEFMLGNGIITHNCRLLSDTSKLDAFINSIGGTALSVGSCRVSTINLARIAYEALGYDKNVNVDLTKIDLEKAKQRYLKILEERTLLDCKALFSMRHILKRNIEKGLLPNYCDGGVELDKQFCTIGAIAAYEVMDLFGLIQTDEFDNKSYSDGAVEFMTQILDTINRVKDSFDCDYSMNLECIPGENCAGVICQADNLLFRQSRYFIYSNQWIPLMAKCTLQEKCRLGHLFDEKCGGGTIAHINVENRFPNEQAAWDMLNYVAASGVIYSAFTTKINVCEHKHASIGTSTCPECGGPIVDQFARVVGFYVPISSYQKIRKREFDLRKWYNVLESERLF